MKSIISKVSALLSKVEEEIEKRENYFDEKSEKWQESAAGEKYGEQTELLHDLLSGLEDFTGSIED